MSIDITIQRQVGTGERTFSLDVQLRTQAKRIALFGPSGSGKTLTVQAVAGLMKPSSGHIRIGQRTFYNSQQRIWLAPQKRRMAYLLQDYGLFPHLTVAQNICFGLSSLWVNPRRKPKLPASAQRWIEAFELQAILENYPTEISGGQKQRTAMARALAVEPELLVLDEPLSALDVQLRIRMRKELAQLQSQLEIPSIIITHDPEDAVELADEVFRIQNGKIVAKCHPAELMQHAEHLREQRQLANAVDDPAVTSVYAAEKPLGTQLGLA